MKLDKRGFLKDSKSDIEKVKIKMFLGRFGMKYLQVLFTDTTVGNKELLKEHKFNLHLLRQKDC